MRVSSILAMGLLAAGVLGTVASSTVPAAAATRHHHYRVAAQPPLVVQVPPRSFLDPGPVVPVGSLSSYVYVSQYPLSMPYDNMHFGRPPLPDQPVPQFTGLDFGPLSGP